MIVGNVLLFKISLNRKQVRISPQAASISSAIEDHHLLLPWLAELSGLQEQIFLHGYSTEMNNIFLSVIFGIDVAPPMAGIVTAPFLVSSLPDGLLALLYDREMVGVLHLELLH